MQIQSLTALSFAVHVKKSPVAKVSNSALVTRPFGFVAITQEIYKKYKSRPHTRQQDLLQKRAPFVFYFFLAPPRSTSSAPGRKKEEFFLKNYANYVVFRISSLIAPKAL